MVYGMCLIAMSVEGLEFLWGMLDNAHSELKFSQICAKKGDVFASFSDCKGSFIDLLYALNGFSLFSRKMTSSRLVTRPFCVFIQLLCTLFTKCIVIDAYFPFFTI